MTELLTAAQMRAIEAAAIASGQVTGLELMERAGRGVVEAVWEEWPELKAGSFKAVVLCGPGNNGGDGFVVARLLKEWGWEVEVFLYGDADKLPPDARVNYERWVGMGEVRAGEPELQGDDIVVIDAIFGSGLSRPLEGLALETVRHVARLVSGADKVCAIDAPSGLCLDSGRVLGQFDGAPMVMSANLTVAFEVPKIGHHAAQGFYHCGKVVLKEIGLPGHKRLASLAALYGLPRSGHENHTRVARLLDQVSLFPLDKGANSEAHKFSHGHALILSGGSGKGGAARMTARGALRVGAGLVTLGVLPEALPENAARLDAVMLRTVEDAEALAEALEDERINALCLGPGLGVDDRGAALLATALAGRGPNSGAGAALGNGGVNPRRPTVLDADALTLLSRDPALFALLDENCVLTPHGGEFARLFPDIAARLAEPASKGPAYSKVDATRDAAKRAGCVVLYKGPDTVIADPDGRCSINSAHYDRAAPWLATAGSGDVLAGFITGLLARGFGPMQAAETAAWLHVECARSFGPGLIAEDLPEELPKVFRTLGL